MMQVVFWYKNVLHKDLEKLYAMGFCSVSTSFIAPTSSYCMPEPRTEMEVSVVIIAIGDSFL